MLGITHLPAPLHKGVHSQLLIGCLTGVCVSVYVCVCACVHVCGLSWLN